VTSVLPLRSVADALAFQLGASPELAGRGAAAMLHELASSTRRNGHTYLTWSELQSAVLSMLEQTGARLQHAPAGLRKSYILNPSPARS
jgi:hypothetical protein